LVNVTIIINVTIKVVDSIIIPVIQTIHFPIPSIIMNHHFQRIPLDPVKVHFHHLTIVDISTKIKLEILSTKIMEKMVNAIIISNHFHLTKILVMV